MNAITDYDVSQAEADCPTCKRLMTEKVWTKGQIPYETYWQCDNQRMWPDRE